MSPEPIATPNPNGGPNTPEGRAISSRNSLTFGLYAAADFVRPNEESDYHNFAEQLRCDLAPVGLLENSLVDEIRCAMWRLARCGEVERSFVTDHAGSASIPDPMSHEPQAKLQLSVDRARALYQRLLHKCTAELRKLQTERQLRNESNDAGIDHPQITTRVNAQPGSFCKTPRNAQCPCGSGQKHKRCCGRNSLPLPKAAEGMLKAPEEMQKAA